MRPTPIALRLTLPTLLVATLVSGPAAHAIPATTVDFKATPLGFGTVLNGHFSFEYSGGAAEFGLPACVTCDLTAFSFTDNNGHVWSSTGVGTGGVNAFSLVFGAAGNITSWAFGLDPYPVPCFPPAQGYTGCVATAQIGLNSIVYGASETESWPADTGHDAGRAGTATVPYRVSYKEVPEPSSLALLGLALGILPRMRRGLTRRRSLAN